MTCQVTADQRSNNYMTHAVAGTPRHASQGYTDDPQLEVQVLK